MGKIQVRNVAKTYKHYPKRWSRLAEWLTPSKQTFHSEIPVLNDINLTINPGDATALVGVNGAGKSTLLKMIAGIVRPSSGEIITEGSIASLLELGMGFHDDFSGRDNVYMAGQLLGMTSEKINSLMPDIEAFAGIGHYIDEPVRTYSSGMQVRLAFSVATAVRPDILIIDEALSVGDAYFQHKSFNRIKEFKEQGTTLLFVSHDRQTVQSICEKAVLIADGRIEKIGDPEYVMDYYNALLAEKEESTIEQTLLENGVVQTSSGTREATIDAIYLLDQHHEKTNSLNVGESATLVIKARCHQSIDSIVLGFMIKDKLGQPIYGINTHRLDKAQQQLHTGESIEYRFAFNANIGTGNYSIAAALSSGDSHLEKNFEWRDQSLIFNVTNIDKEPFVGACWLNPSLTISREQ